MTQLKTVPTKKQTAQIKESDNLEQQAAAAINESLEKFLELAWQHVRHPESIDILEQHARTIDGYALHWSAFDYVKNRCQTDDTSVYFDRVNETGTWLAQHDCALLQPFIWAAQYKDDHATAGFLLKAIGEAGPVLDSRLINLCLDNLYIVEQYNLKRQIAVTIIGIMRPQGCEERLLQLIDEYIEVVTGKAEFEASLESIGWKDLLSATADTLKSMASPQSKKASIVIAKLKELMQILRQIHDVGISIAVMDALIAWGETNQISTISRLLKCGDDQGEIAALKAVEKLAPYWAEEERLSFAALEFCNPSDYQRTVTLLFYRALNALVKADPSLGEPVSIQDAVDEAMQLDCYSDEAITEWQIVECETVALEPTLDIETIASYLQSEQSAVRRAAQRAYQARGKTFKPIEPQLSWLQQTQGT